MSSSQIQKHTLIIGVAAVVALSVIVTPEVYDFGDTLIGLFLFGILLTFDDRKDKTIKESIVLASIYALCALLVLGVFIEIASFRMFNYDLTQSVFLEEELKGIKLLSLVELCFWFFLTLIFSLWRHYGIWEKILKALKSKPVNESENS